MSMISHRNTRQTAITAMLVTALLWACAALPAQATKGGIPAAPDAASGNANQAQGVGQGVGQAPVLPDAVPDGAGAGGVQETVTSTPTTAPEGGGQGGGANDLSSGPYDPDPLKPELSGVGEPSGNGASEDNNGKRPAAGTVGNADNKNPPGQLPDGSDDNKGYECDENEGVGKMNPAHSGCLEASQPPTTSVTPPVTDVPPTTAVTPPAVPPAEAPPPGAGAEEEEGGAVGGVEDAPEPPETPATRPVVTTIPARAPLGTTAEKVSELPFTGSEPLRLGLLGLLALLAGIGLARALRTRSHA